LRKIDCFSTYSACHVKGGSVVGNHIIDIILLSKENTILVGNIVNVNLCID